MSPLSRRLLASSLALLLGACASLTSTSVSEQQINDYLASKAGFEKSLGIPGIMSAKIRLGDLKSHIGRSAPDKIDLDGAGDLTITTPSGRQAMSVRLALRARPDYQPKQGAIYLQDLELISVATEPDDVGAALTPLLPMISLSLSQFLEQTPVYRLNEKNEKEAMAKEHVGGLEVRPGRLEIPLTLL
ncbi:lipoprotein [Aeromonas diversa]|uniref:Lipoprotein n=1 Tax=Aeromonas diversa CDC 2478-85 TaxID=1268237 RepID=N9VKK3_9GAMM|nr:lipoprotein [Aeromonas diversa]ENY71891.1 lipoprotein [Aeromonas diversa CDC 2478-85]